jgi:hypothetical protein
MVATFVLSHRHTPSECRIAFAAWRGFPSPLRDRPALSSCSGGDHQLWWLVDAPDAAGALAMLPSYVATRTTVAEVVPQQLP